MSARVHGKVGVLGAMSDDGRKIDPAGFAVGRLPLPLMALTAPGAGHDGARLAGRITAVQVLTAGAVLIEAVTGPEFEVDLYPGVYGCGMDMGGPRRTDGRPGGRLDMGMEWRKPDGGSVPDEEVTDLLDAGVDLVQVFTRTELLGVTVHGRGSSGRAVWPGVQVMVEAAS